MALAASWRALASFGCPDPDGVQRDREAVVGPGKVPKGCSAPRPADLVQSFLRSDQRSRVGPSSTLPTVALHLRAAESQARKARPAVRNVLGNWDRKARALASFASRAFRRDLRQLSLQRLHRRLPRQSRQGFATAKPPSKPATGSRPLGAALSLPCFDVDQLASRRLPSLAQPRVARPPQLVGALAPTRRVSAPNMGRPGKFRGATF